MLRPEKWLAAVDRSGHGIIWLWNSWQTEGTTYDQKRIQNVIETFGQPGVSKAAIDWYRQHWASELLGWTGQFETIETESKKIIDIY